MNAPTSPARRGRSITTWVATTIALCGTIFLIEVALHHAVDRRVRSSYAFVNTIGHARTDLYLGFLHLSLGGQPESPWQQNQGQALLVQSLEEFRRSLALVPSGLASKRALEDRLKEFSGLTADLGDLARDPGNEVRLRTELFKLDEAVARVDSEARGEFQQTDAQLHPYFVSAEALSGLLLLIVSLGAVWADRRQAAAIGRLTASEERFRQLFEDAPLPMVLVGRSGEITALNQAFHQVFGYAAADIPRLEDWRRLAFPDPEYRAGILASFQEYLQQSDPEVRAAGREVHVICKDGGERVVVASGIVLEAGDTLATFADVTERNRARKALIDETAKARAARAEAEDNRAKLEAALASMSDAVFISDLDGRFIHLNDAFATYHRFRSKAECAKTFAEYPDLLEVSFSDGRPAPVDMWAVPRALRGETAVEQEYRLRRKDTGETWVGSYNFAPIRDGAGRIVGSVVSGRDITERKQAERDLFESRERLRLLIEHAPVALAMFDRDMRYLAASRRWLTDYRLGDINVIDRSHYEIFPEITESWREVHRRALAGEVVTREEDAFTRGDGAVQWLRWEARPWFGPTGEVGGIVIFTEDISRRKQAEAELRDSQEKLARAQKLEAVGQLTGGIAHDFNNILAVIMGNVELLRATAHDRPKEMECIERSLRATRRGADLTRRLLAYARQQELRPELVELNTLVSEAVQLLSRTLGENISVETHFAANVDRALVDPGQLENAILNLAVNARDAMPEGGKLTISTGRAVVGEADARAYGVPAGVYETIVVTDTGTGMPAQVLERAFDPFFTTKPPGKGTGLGLSMVYGFAKQSGGHISAYSEPGHGTTIRLYLPVLAAAQAAAAGVIGEAVPHPGSGERILLVEDSADVRELVGAQLISLGYRVEACESGPAALAYLGTGAPVDLILTDVVMAGGMNGVELIEAVHKDRPDVPAIYMSGYAQGGNAQERIRRIGGRLLEKPFTILQLSEALDFELSGRKA